MENQNTANQNTVKPLYIRWHYTQPSHHAPRVCWIDCVALYFLWQIVMPLYRVVPWNIPLVTLFSRYTYSTKGSCVYRENTSGWWDILWCTTRKRYIIYYYVLYKRLTGILLWEMLSSYSRFRDFRDFFPSQGNYGGIKGCLLKSGEN